MRNLMVALTASLAAGITLFSFATAFGQKTPEARPAPLMRILSRFTAPGVPVAGPGESEVAPRKWDKPAPPLPGNGMAQHPMLYIGEGYNKILLVNNGKIAWTYSTGSGWEYDDVDAIQWQCPLHAHAICRRGDTGKEGRMAL